jgi:hypothetical protein
VEDVVETGVALVGFNDVGVIGTVRQDTVVVVEVTSANVLVTLLLLLNKGRKYTLGSQLTVDRRSRSSSNDSRKQLRHGREPD